MKQNFNAQLFCRKLHVFHAASFRARVSASEMLSCMNSSKFESWKCTTESFILNWKDQDRRHEPLVNANSYFSENQKKELIEN